MPSSAREEAERLVAAVMAVADTAGLGGLADSLRDAVGRVAGNEHKPPAGQESAGSEHKPPAEEHKPRAEERNPAGGEHKPPAEERDPAGSEHKPSSGGAKPGAGGRASSVGEHKLASGWATGSAECCVCPVCRAIAAARNPGPETAVRIATGAGDLATGLAGLMRGLSRLAGDRPKRAAKPAPRPAPSPDEAWSTATRRADSSDNFSINPENRVTDGDPWAAAGLLLIGGIEPWALWLDSRPAARS